MAFVAFTARLWVGIMQLILILEIVADLDSGRRYINAKIRGVLKAKRCFNLLGEKRKNEFPCMISGRELGGACIGRGRDWIWRNLEVLGYKIYGEIWGSRGESG